MNELLGEVYNMQLTLKNGQQVELLSDEVLKSIKSAARVVNQDIDEVINGIILEKTDDTAISLVDVGVYVQKRRL